MIVASFIGTGNKYFKIIVIRYVSVIKKRPKTSTAIFSAMLWVGGGTPWFQKGVSKVLKCS